MFANTRKFVPQQTSRLFAVCRRRPYSLRKGANTTVTASETLTWNSGTPCVVLFFDNPGGVFLNQEDRKTILQ